MKTALCIGINAYGHNADLAGCVNDANDWQAVLESRGFTSRSIVDSEATRDAILDAMRSAIDPAKSGDTVIITYSGHGTWINDEGGDEADGRDEALCPVDCFDGRIITDDELLEVFSLRNRGVRLVFISDSCHSGTVHRFAGPQRSEGEQPRVRFLPPANLPIPKKLIPRGPSRAPTKRLKSSALLLSGCTDLQFSYDAWFNGRANGAATRAYLTALKTLPANATYRHWMDAVRGMLPTPQFPQSPQLQGTSDQKRWKVL